MARCEFWVNGRGSSILAAWAQEIFGGINLCSYGGSYKPEPGKQKAPDGRYYKPCTSTKIDKKSGCKVFGSWFD
jgi:hypothetical protein